MKLTARQRWIGYAVAAIATLAAMVWVDEAPDADADLAVVGVPERATSDGRSRPALQLAEREPQWRVFAAKSADLFDTPAWQSPPSARRQSVASAAPLPVKRGPPPVPFTYLGRWIEDGTTQVYLTSGEKDYRAIVGGKLGANYRVKSIDERQMVLEYLPMRTLQMLPLHAAAQAAAEAPPHQTYGDESIAESSEDN